VQWVSVPLAVLGVIDDGGFRRRFLISWLVVMAAAIPLGWITGWFPPDRIVTFGFAVPIAAALGVGWVLSRLVPRPWIARVAVGALVAWMIAGGLLAWFRQSTFVSVREAHVAQYALFRVGTPPGSPARKIVVIVDDPDATATFLAARAANIVRAAGYSQRAGDVFVFVGRATDFFAGRPTTRGDPEYDGLSRITFQGVPTSGGRIVLVLAPFYRGDDLGDVPELMHLDSDLWSSEDLPEVSVAAGLQPLGFGPSSAWGITIATLAILMTLTVLGLGSAAAVFSDRVTMLATAPAFGAASVTIVAVVLDRLGLRLVEIPVALAASGLAGLGGLVLFLVQRQRDRQPSA